METETTTAKLTIGYEFDFWLTIRKRNGKLFNNHHIIGLGLDFNLALWDVYHTLKKRKSRIEAINKARPLRIAFAFGADHQPVKTSLAEHPPLMPENLETELLKLPKL
ncbi:hypothetical protein LT679_02010 [Mucilaginibacter roseus]|uniref:Uncharacterized protein n=1 Tax=Mucilaginibacter roseus TaxID=1528868 RepID=A0ABS8U0A4_9SPHI|nr:hypothetical protein [Mucilaginibacter roseus]MCD8739364.1 hypothetical protein [Mucilaginibacter roseus]